ncbi:MAG: hypothetical protein NZM34_01955 [Bernardetiaceae bacterium]|nr:hypothetical protein [Bernardetiaceae bacterium]
MKTITITPEMYPVIIKAYEEKKAKLQEQIKLLQSQIKEIEAEINELSSELKKKPEGAEKTSKKRGAKAISKRKQSSYLKLDYDNLVLQALQAANGKFVEVADIQASIIENQGLDESYAQKVGANVYRILSEMKKQNKVIAEKIPGSRKIAYKLV